MGSRPSLLRPVVVLFLLSTPLGPAFGDDPPPDRLQLALAASLRLEGTRRVTLEEVAPMHEEGENRLLYRLRPLLGVQPSGEWEFLVQPQLYGVQGSDPYAFGSLYQAGVLWSGETLQVRAGRQELVFGSAFLLGADTFYDGLSYDAVRATFSAPRSVTIDLFGGLYVPRNSGGVEGSLGGAYVACEGRSNLRLEVYGVVDRGAAEGEEVDTLSLGSRVVVPLRGGVQLELEPTVQRGEYAPAGESVRTVQAWGGHVDLIVPLGRWQLGASLAAGSSEGDPDDGRWEEFRHPSHDTSQIGDLGLVGDLGGFTVGNARASGLRTVTVSAAAPLGRTSVACDLHLIRAGRVYGAPSRDVGAELDAAVGIPLAEQVALTLALSHFRGGEFFAAGDSPPGFTHAYAGLDLTF